MSIRNVDIVLKEVRNRSRETDSDVPMTKQLGVFGFMKKNKGQHYKRIVGLLAGGALIGVSPSLWAGSFQTVEQNGAGLPTAYAGAGSIAEDASTGFYNAAGLTRLHKEQIVVSNVFVFVSPTIYPTAIAPTTTFQSPGMEYTSTKGRNSIASPGLHYAKRIDDRWVFSFNIAAPFGAKNNFNDGFVGRYMSHKSELRTVNIGPSLAYGFDNGLSLGGGLDAMHLNARLNAKLGNGAVSRDGFQENSLSSWGLGYHVGVLYELSDDTRFGAQYRSEVKQDAKGESLTQAPAAIPLTVVARQDVQAHIKLPETVGVSVFHSLNDCWAVMADAAWTHWNRFDRIYLAFANGSSSNSLQMYKNSYKASLGFHYQFHERWKLKFGTAFDKSPVIDQRRGVRLPDKDRYWAAIGLERRVSKHLAFNLGYAHIFSRRAIINDYAPTLAPTQTGQRLLGTSKTKVDLVGIQLTWDLV